MKTFKTPKGTELPLLDLRGKDYLQVAHRIRWFREERGEWGIETELKCEKDYAIARAIVRDISGRIISTATKYEDKQGFGDFIEKAETGAIGRALAFCGYGTQFTPGLDEGERLADAPLEKKTAAIQASQSKSSALTPTASAMSVGSNTEFAEKKTVTTPSPSASLNLKKGSSHVSHAVPECELGCGPLRKNEKTGGWYCADYKNKEKGWHTSMNAEDYLSWQSANEEVPTPTDMPDWGDVS
jgi:hypothetical protein